MTVKKKSIIHDVIVNVVKVSIKLWCAYSTDLPGRSEVTKKKLVFLTILKVRVYIEQEHQSLIALLFDTSPLTVHTLAEV